MPRQKITDVEALAAFARIKNGECLTKVAKSIGMSGSGLRDRLKKMGYKVGGHYWFKLSPEIIEKVMIRVKRGESVVGIAKEVGVNPMTLHRHIQRRWKPVGRAKRKSSVKMPTNPIVLAYIAGIFDGEGWITKRNTGGGYWCIGISNTNREVLSFIAGVIGIKVGKRKQRKCPKNTHIFAKVSYDITIQHALGVSRFIIGILPYLIIKKKKALECLKEIGAYIPIEDYTCSIWDKPEQFILPIEL